MIWRLFRAGEEKGGDETGTLIWTTLVMNFWLSWKKNHTHTHNKFLSFIRRSHLICLLPLGEEQRDQRFYMMFPACRTMLGWLQRNPCDGVRWELLEQCLGLSLVSALCRDTPSHSAAQAVHWGVLLPLSPWDRLCNACQLPCLVSSSVRKRVFLPTESFWLH